MLRVQRTKAEIAEAGEKLALLRKERERKRRAGYRYARKYSASAARSYRLRALGRGHELIDASYFARLEHLEIMQVYRDEVERKHIRIARRRCLRGFQQI